MKQVPLIVASLNWDKNIDKGIGRWGDKFDNFASQTTTYIFGAPVESANIY